MIALLLCSVASSIGFGPFDPLDGFRTNCESLAVRCKFTYTQRLTDDGQFRAVLNNPNLGRDLQKEQALLTVSGRWERLGHEERVVLGQHSPRQKPEVGMRYELLRDSTMCAYHFLGHMALEVRPVDEPPMPVFGPFAWRPEPLPNYLQSEFSDAQLSHQRIELEGRLLHVATYNKSTDVSTRTFQIFYDPAWNYLPRRIRSFSIGSKQTVAGVIDTHILDAKPCTRGGMLPIEWIEGRYSVNDFNATYPSFNATTELKPSSRVVMGHFLASDVEDFQGQVALQETEDLQIAATAGGHVPFSKSSKKHPITISTIRSMLGRKLTSPAPPAMTLNLDHEEMNRFKKTTGWRFNPYIAIPVLAAAGFFVFWLVRSKFSTLAALIGLMVLSGCSQSQKASSPQLSAGFEKMPVVVRAASPGVELPLHLDNNGNTDIEISKIDGGCTCRKFEGVQLPLRLSAGANVTLTAKLTGSKNFNPTILNLALHTSNGVLSVPAEMNTMQDHVISPSVLTFSSIEGEQSILEGEIIHRAIFRAGDAVEKTSLRIPSHLEIIKTETESGPIGAVQDLMYSDTKYLVKLKDRRIGTFKDTITLQDSQGAAAVEVPVAWQRSPFLSSIPERVVLFKRPARVFLRCPDEAVELKRIVSCPAGMRAVIASPREISVSIVNDQKQASGDSAIVVETTHDKHGILKIPVVHVGAAEFTGS